MILEKKEHIFKPTGQFDWSLTHAQVPFAFELKDKIRVFFSTRDKKNRSNVSFLDVEKSNPSKIIYIHNKPILQNGGRGSFDDSGTMPSWFLEHDGEIWMYYTAWNRSEDAAYRLSIGLAVSKDGGLSFKRSFKGPILDRGKYDPIWVGQPCVLKMAEKDWKMWYLSCQKIEMIEGRPEPFYIVKYATSKNGYDWHREEIECIGFDKNTDAIGRPCVWRDNDVYKMLHSNRKADGYRKIKGSAYRIEYSESLDGKSWVSRPDILNFKKSNTGWDSVMNEYCSVYTLDDKLFMLYNGNGFGAEGFGFARFNLKND